MPARLQDRIALITGSSSGIGRCTALKFAAEGARVVCADLTEGTWRRGADVGDEADGPTHEVIRARGGEAVFVSCDVSRPRDVEGAVRRAVEWGGRGRLDVVVNNAGFALETRDPRAVWDMEIDSWRKTMDVNLDGVFYGVKYASAQMIHQDPLPSGDRGWILNAASVVGLVGTPAAPAYCASKGGVANLTRAAALDCAPYRVHVNAVCPGYVESHMTDPLLGKGGDEGVRGAIQGLHPFRGTGRPEDVAAVYCFLASDEAGWMSGVCLPVDGGYTAR